MIRCVVKCVGGGSATFIQILIGVLCDIPFCSDPSSKTV